MTYWYVDFENVHSEADLGMLLNQAKRGDTIIIYYSAVCPMFPLKQIQNLAHRGIKLRAVECVVGTKDAADFQIVMDLAVGCTEHPTIRHIVYSRDQGFVNPLKAWKKRGCDVNVCSPQTAAKQSHYLL